MIDLWILRVSVAILVSTNVWSSMRDCAPRAWLWLTIFVGSWNKFGRYFCRLVKSRHEKLHESELVNAGVSAAQVIFGR